MYILSLLDPISRNYADLKAQVLTSSRLKFKI